VTRAPDRSTRPALEPGLRTLPALLADRAARARDRPFCDAGDGSRTFGEAAEHAARLAGALRDAGVAAGDRVATLSENRIELLDLLAACSWLGAVLVPVNAAARGTTLAHVLATARPTALAVDSALTEALVELEPPGCLRHLWLLGAGDAAWGGLSGEPLPAPGPALEPHPSRPGDTVAILFTSGTSGPPKGVCCPHGQFAWWGVNTAAALGVTADDVLYTCLPLFHTNALNTWVQALVHGCRFVLGPRFSASRFWQRLGESGATVTYILGAMASILARREPGAGDRAHSVRVALAPATLPELHRVFRERFGIDLVDGHGMTETNLVIGPRDGQQRPGWMGRVMPGFSALVVDDDDEEVPDGTPGELVLRADEPFAFATGYWDAPEATVRAWRNLWFHTGDRVVRDPAGWFRFIDRIKDSIRRRGENISAWEVEHVVGLHPHVAAVAAVPVPAELGDDEVMIFVVPAAGAQLDPAALVRHCDGRLARYAIPRFVEIVEALPLTENGKVRKVVLRERGVSASTWDREVAGVELGA
jgi:crotonobetaine/carnitine-CoA ligase